MRLGDALGSTAQLLSMDPEKQLGRTLDKDTLRDLGINTYEAGAAEIQAWRLLRMFETEVATFPDQASFDSFHRMLYMSIIAGIRYGRNDPGTPQYDSGRESLTMEYDDLPDLEAWVQARHEQLAGIKPTT